jgi:K+-sensing histidine kinase KdpD
VWVCAIGLSQDSERVLRLAGRAATEAGARLTVIHAAREEAALDARRRLDELLGETGSGAAVAIAIGPVKEALLDTAHRCAADALILGRRLPTGSFGRLRDLTYSLIRDAPFPVLSV